MRTLALTLLLLGTTASRCDPQGPVRVAAVGDSIVLGLGSSHDGGWRFYSHVAFAFYELDVDLVGMYSDGNFPDPEHSGVGSASCTHLAGVLDATLHYQPHVLWLACGLNDVWLFGPEVATDALRARIEQAIAWGVPEIVVQGLIRNDIGLQADVDLVNAALPGIVAEFADHPTSRVRFADGFATLLDATDLVDGIHPNDTGYAKMGWEVFQVLTAP